MEGVGRRIEGGGRSRMREDQGSREEEDGRGGRMVEEKGSRIEDSGMIADRGRREEDGGGRWVE